MENSTIMVKQKFNKKFLNCNKLFSQRLLGKAVALIAILSALVGANCGMTGEVPFTEYQVKALFILNFIKYVDWPDGTFADTNAPIVIGVLGENKITKDLGNSIKGRTDSRQISIRQVEKNDDLQKFQILFISASEKKRLVEILVKTKSLPVLTVGETEGFIDQGGIINFVMKEKKVRLEINARVASEAGLHISSKLLSVADVVRGKDSR